MSRRSIGRNVMAEKLAGVQDWALRLTMMLKSPYKKHRKAGVAMGEMVNKMQGLVAEAQEPVAVEV